MATAAAVGVGFFRASAVILSRSQGHSAAGKAAYNSRSRIENGRTGEVFDFTRLPNQVLSEHFYAPANAPEWAKTRESYWNAVELREKATNSQLAMDWVIDLPHQMQQNPEHARYALQDFIRENFTRNGYGADLVFHPAHDHGDERNFHAHLMVSLRKIEKDGTWSKTKAGGVPDPEQLVELKRQMAYQINKRLDKYEYGIQVDHRSYEARGIDREPTLHLGKDAAALERRGIKTQVGDLNREIEARNEVRVMVRVHEMKPVEVEIVSAIDRQKLEDQAARSAAQQQAERDLARGSSVANHARELLSAIRRLFVTMGGSLGNVITVDPGDLKGQGRTLRTEAVEERRRFMEEAATAAQAARMAPPAFDPKFAREELTPERLHLQAIDKMQDNQRIPMPAEKTAAPQPEQQPEKRETLRDRLRREAAEEGREIEVELKPQPARRMERKLEIRRPRRPDEDDYRV